ncbi:MAG TPA: SDR family oxidoreductase [Myxococcales bacterium]|jgi:NADP-dependent 3-hydroxy acid dehydrogenase YdfG|nr:SDR family oxidoreductase [Myxococcales bacterium]
MKVAVVTGVTSGIGKAIAAKLLGAGMQVVGLGRRCDRLEATVSRFGPSFMPVCADLASRTGRRRALALLREQLPRVDFIINNAAECVFETPLKLEADRFAQLLEVNLLAGIELIQTLAPALPADGHVLSISSVTARHVAHERFTPYALTKTALERFNEGLRLELAPRGIKVSLIVPGLVDTPIYDKVEGFESTRAALSKHVPAWLSADDVADAALWMLTRPAAVVASELVLLPRFQAR